MSSRPARLLQPSRKQVGWFSSSGNLFRYYVISHPLVCGDACVAAQHCWRHFNAHTFRSTIVTARLSLVVCCVAVRAERARINTIRRWHGDDNQLHRLQIWQQSFEKWHRWKIIVIIFLAGCLSMTARAKWDAIAIHGWPICHKNWKAFPLNADWVCRTSLKQIKSSIYRTMCSHRQPPSNNQNHRLQSSYIYYKGEEMLLFAMVVWQVCTGATALRCIDNGQLPAIFDIIYRWYVIVIGYAVPYNMCRLSTVKTNGGERERGQMGVECALELYYCYRIYWQNGSIELG